LGGNLGDGLLGKTIPSASGSDPLRRLHGVGFVWQSRREVEEKASVDGVGSLSRCVRVYRGVLRPVGQSNALVLEDNRHTTGGTETMHHFMRRVRFIGHIVIGHVGDSQPNRRKVDEGARVM
jgi:hypothetical protein